MFDKDPALMFPGFEYKAAGGTVTANSIVIPLAALPGLSAEEADSTGVGDSRIILHRIIGAARQYYESLETADKPAQMQLFRSSSPPNEITGIITRTFTARFGLDSGELEVAAES